MPLAEQTIQFTEAAAGSGEKAVRYFEAGEGAPLVVLGGGGAPVRPGHELLAAGRRVVVVELPGFGGAGAEPAGLADLVATVGATLDVLGLEQFDLMGSSFGAVVAAALAIERPSAIKALVLVAPAVILPADWQPPSSPEDLRSRLFAEGSELEAPPVDAATIEAANALAARLFGADARAQIESGLGSLEVPTLVVFGSDDEIIPSRLGSRYAAQMPDASLVLVYAAGHVPEVERPEAFSDVVGDFLDRGPEFVIGTESTLINP